MMELSADELREKLVDVQAKTQHYLDAKRGRHFVFRPSAQRKIRLAGAEELLKFTNTMIEQIDQDQAYMGKSDRRPRNSARRSSRRRI